MCPDTSGHLNAHTDLDHPLNGHRRTMQNDASRRALFLDSHVRPGGPKARRGNR